MQKTSVRELMVPISEYATVKVGSTLLDAALALEKAQETFTANKYQHRAILVLGTDNKVVGKVGQMRVLKAVESRYDLDSEIGNLGNFNFSDDYIAKSRAQSRMQSPILDDDTLRAAAEKNVEEFMQKPTPGEFVSADSSLDTAIHKLVDGTHLSLLVTEHEEIVGVLRIADVFAAVFHKMRDTGIASAE